MSPAGNLYASHLIRLRPGDPPAPSLALVCAVALHEAIGPWCARTRIKWPNDLVVDGAKLAGILLEREGEAVIAGFGVNLANHPQLPDRPTTSLAALEGSAPSPDQLLEALAESLARWIGRWRSQGLDPVRARWMEGALPIGTALATSEGEGLFEGLDPSGALCLRSGDGKRLVVQAGDVFLL